jgi:prepilin-type N-terminal cleavage/methylation domain-containing protein
MDIKHSLKVYTTMKTRRSAFTLIELLVVIAIIAVLIGLLVPAVQKARESAARTQCQNNLRQIGVALHNYHSDHKAFPAGCDKMGFAVHCYLLPYLEQGAIYKTINFNLPVTDPANQGLQSMVVPTFLCPSDPTDSPPSGWAGNNYVGNIGSDLPFFAPNNGIFFMTGFFTGGFQIRITDIQDGSSNTAAFCERLKGDFSQGILTPATDIILDPQDYSGLVGPNAADIAMNDCRGKSLGFTNEFRSDFGGYWSQAWHMTLYYHTAPPGDPSCAFFPDKASMTASSAHQQGVNLLLCDGSVHWVSYSISLATWRALGTRGTGDLLGSDFE